MTDQRTPTPVHRNEREQAMFYLVPLAGARRKVANLNVQARLLRESTEFEFPQAHTVPVAAATVSGDDQLFGLWIPLAAHAQPPAPDGLYRECRRVVVGAYAHPGIVGTDVINPIGVGSTKFWIDEVVNLDLYRLSTGQSLLPGILVRTHQLLLLGVHRNHRLVGLQGG